MLFRCWVEKHKLFHYISIKKMRLICMCVSEKNILLCSHNKLNHIYSNGGGKNFYTALQRWKTCKKNMTIRTKKYCGNKICALLYYSNRITGPHWFALISHLMVSLSSWWGRRTCSYPFSMLFCIFCFFPCNTSTRLYSSFSSIDRL